MMDRYDLEHISLFQFEREISESSSSLMRSKERISELEQRVSYMEKVISHVNDCNITVSI